MSTAFITWTGKSGGEYSARVSSAHAIPFLADVASIGGHMNTIEFEGELPDGLEVIAAAASKAREDRGL